ncbi:hypothetical protein KSP40_PGU014683 [Platanthera guangdongensis]|uniref:Uncharacterized protein n=1 Tax=Platanthera guangdongensis TaxID=2320717 RepID=A0ABR2LCU8_9ASPA
MELKLLFGVWEEVGVSLNDGGTGLTEIGVVNVLASCDRSMIGVWTETDMSFDDSGMGSIEIGVVDGLNFSCVQQLEARKTLRIIASQLTRSSQNATTTTSNGSRTPSTASSTSLAFTKKASCLRKKVSVFKSQLLETPIATTADQELPNRTT